MAKQPNPKYVFRGTTIGWPGNDSSQVLPITCTTTHPVKAILFALCCNGNNTHPAIYIAKTSQLQGLKISKNVFAFEDEVGYEIAPTDFLNLCEGYISIRDAIRIVRELDITPPLYTDIAMLSMRLKAIPSISKQLIIDFYNMAEPFLR